VMNSYLVREYANYLEAGRPCVLVQQAIGIYYLVLASRYIIVPGAD
jgi:hypothetical protein